MFMVIFFWSHYYANIEIFFMGVTKIKLEISNLLFTEMGTFERIKKNYNMTYQCPKPLGLSFNCKLALCGTIITILVQ